MNELNHYGKKGMKWGKRHVDPAAQKNRILYGNLGGKINTSLAGLYGTNAGEKEYRERGFNTSPSESSWRDIYIDVAKLANEYRTKVNPKVNLYCVQTAGYDNVVLPELFEEKEA